MRLRQVKMDEYGDELSSGIKCIKYLVVTFNWILMVTGVLIIDAGITIIHSIYYNLDKFLETKFFSPAILLIVTGSFILVIAIFGCFGALKESICMMNCHAILLGLIFILEISAGIAALAFQSQIRATIANNINSTMYESADNEKAAVTIDFIQKELSCCGINGPTDWQGILDDRASFKIIEGDMVMPDSCCSNIITLKEESATCSTYSNGCLPRLTFILEQSAMFLGGAALAVSVIQIIGIFFSILLAKHIRKAKNEKIHRQYEIKRQLRNSYLLIDKENKI